MPLRGESVGSAYVRIYADGSAVPGDIRRSIEDAEPGVREAGHTHGRTYQKAFDEEMERGFEDHFGDDVVTRLNKSLTESLARMQFADDFFDHSLEWKKFKKRMGDEGGDAGRLLAANLEKEFRDSADLSALPDRMRRLGQDLRKAQGEILNSFYDEAYQMNKEFDTNLRHSSEALDREFERRTKDLSSQADRVRDALRRVEEEVGKFANNNDQSFGHDHLRDYLQALPHLFQQAGLGSAEYDDKIRHLRNTLRDSNDPLIRFQRDIGKMADAIGTATGRGSRNNFLNFFGSVTRNLVNLGQVIPATIGWFRTMGRTFTDAETSGAGFAEVLTQVVTGLATGLVAAVALVAIFGVLVAVIGPVVAILSGLVGILVALASTIVFSVVAGIGALLPLLVALGAIVGGVIASVATLKKASGELADEMSKVKSEAKDLYKAFSDQAFKNAPTVFRRINDLLSEQHGLLKAAGKGFNRFSLDISAALDSPAMKAFLDRFERFLPHAMNSLGNIIGNTLKGITGIFRASIPLANRFLGFLDDITNNFAQWANSPKGQKEIRQTLRKAGDSAKALGDFLENATVWLANLLAAGEITGDTIFHNMADDFERWTTWLDDHPNAVQDWFGNAEKLSHDIGDLVDKVNHLVDALDNANSRMEADKGLSGLADFIGGLAWVVSQLTENFGLAVWAVEQFGKAFAQSAEDTGKLLIAIVKWPQQVTDALVNYDWAGLAKGVWHAITAAFASIGDIGGSGGIGANLIDTGAITRQVNKIPGIVISALSHINVGGVVDKITSPFRGVPGQVRSLLAAVPGIVSAVLSPLGGLASRAVTAMTGYFRDLPGKISGGLSTLTSIIGGKFDAAASYISTIPGRIVGYFSGLAGRIISAIGSIDIYPHIHMPSIPHIPYTAKGGVFSGAQFRVIGEAGPEAVVPLSRDLSQVDPAVRELSAIAQGKTPRMAGGGVVGRSVDASGWTIMSNSEDPAIVAAEVINRLVTQVV